MEKKNTILLTVIAIATLLVAVVGATFAYFATTEEYNNVTTLTATTPSASSVFKTEGGTIALTVEPITMVESRAGIASNNANGTLEVSYLSGSTTATSCTYNLYYKYATSNVDEYTRTITDIDKDNAAVSALEFTYKLDGTSDDPNVVSIAEANFANTSSNPVKLTNQLVYINNASATEETVHTYDITATWYNIEANQNAMSDKTFVVDFYVDDVTCGILTLS